MKDYNDISEGDFYGKSKINTAGLINLTLENLWKEAYVTLCSNQMWKWNRKLDAIWLILAGDVNEGSPEDLKFNSIELQIGETGSLFHKNEGFGKTPKDRIQKMALQYQLLMKKSKFLRRLQNKQGKGTAYVDAMEDDFE